MNFITKQPGGILPAGSRACRKPRGVLLLIVLSMLTLFMMLGTTYMVVTSRARATARAFARASAAQQSATDAAGSRMVDDAFRILARGTTNAECKEPALVRGDDLLGDKYGYTLPGSPLAPINGRFVRIDSVAPAVAGLGLIDLQVTQVGLNGNVSGDPLPPVALGGRVLTLTLPGVCRSGRILRAAYANPSNPDSRHLILTISSTSAVDGVETRAADIDRGVKLVPNEYHAVINGREHTGDTTAGDSNEAYDGFAAIPSDPTRLTDPFLASLVPIDGTGKPFNAYTNQDGTIQPNVAVRKMSFFPLETDLANPTHIPVVDNDADGVLDSRWIDIGFPIMTTRDGKTFRAQAAYLVLDLDSRLNVNAHGSLFQYQAMLTSADPSSPILGWPSAQPPLPITANEFNNLPFGSGYGPAEVRIWDLFFDKPGFLATTTDRGVITGQVRDKSERLLFGSASAAADSATNQKRPTLQLTNLEGRYGADAANPNGVIAAGAPEVNDRLSMIRDEGRHPDRVAAGPTFRKQIADSWRAGLSPAALDPAHPSYDADLYASPSDLRGQMKLVADSQAGGDGVVSQMWYVKPQNRWNGDATDDPYEIRLARPSANDNPFLPDELERLLRVYDWDSSQLPTRLAGSLGPDAERLRFLLTTDSWDTTAIVGDTWRKIETTLITRNIPPADLPFLLGPELMTGRRLDLNRQIETSDGTGPDRRQALCRNLYMLLWLLAEGPTDRNICERIAQWAVNVVDFRDSDSVMTTFYYDVDPTDGWNDDPFASPPPEVVIGHERPEILITQALCWKNDDGDGGVHAVLHRPWAAKAFDGPNPLPGSWAPDIRDPDAIDPFLAARNPSNRQLLNALDLGLLAGSDGTPGSGDVDSPVWRMRIGGAANADVIRFDPISDPRSNPPAAFQQHHRDEASSNIADQFVPPDGWVYIKGDRGTPAGDPVRVDDPPPGLPQLVIRQTDGAAGGPTPSSAAGDTDQLLLLERLADPQLPHQPNPLDSNFNPYVEVDRIENVPVADRTEIDPGNNTDPKNYFAVKTRTVGGTTTSDFWQQQFDPATLTPITDSDPYDPNNDAALDKLARPPTGRVAWFPWLNRPFVSPVELLLVPNALIKKQAAAQFQSELLKDYTGFGPPPGLGENGWLDALAADIGVANDQLVEHLFQATIVPSRFADLGVSSVDPLVFQNSGTGLEWLATNHLSSWREPGRVNLNTVSDDRVWDATVRRGPRPPSPTPSPGYDDLDRTDAGFGMPDDITQSPRPAETLLELYGLKSTASSVFADSANTPGQEFSANPQFCCLTANRLANVATNRSNVFAVWVTIGFFECWPNGTFVMIGDPTDPDPSKNRKIPKELGSDTGEISRHRGFYIFDRSIPVGHVTGRDLNLEDAIRLRRIIQ